MTELKDDLDRALRSVTFGEAPVRRAMRDGRRLRNRRRLTAAAGAVAIVAVAAGYPALTRDAATAPPVTGRTQTPSPSHTASPHRDPVITSQPATDVANTGVVARGTVGGTQWSVAISGGTGAHDQACFTAFAGSGSTGLAARSAGQLMSSCGQDLQTLVSYSAPDPAGFTTGTGTVNGGTTYVSALGAVAPNVTYFILDFTDGQRLKLIPVTFHGHRYVAWVAPGAMTVARLTAHLGSARADSGQILTAIPYDEPGGPLIFELWFKPGQSLPPRASGVIGGGTHDGHVWSESAYEGPWGTCFVDSPGNGECLAQARLGTTQLFVHWDSNSAKTVFGSAAPEAKKLFITLSDGTVVGVTPVTVGNERLFAFWAGKGVSPTGWTAYDAKGHKIGHGSVTR